MPETRFLYTRFDAHGPHQTDVFASSDDSPPLVAETPSTSSGSTSASTSLAVPAALRRVHTKSRRGCLNCKRRRIKCPENHPTCTQCTKRGLSCEWPGIQIQQSSGARQDLQRYISSPKQTSIDSPPPRHGFTMQDFRLFNHFKSDSHPFHPVGNEEIWTHDVPSISHKYDFLLHSMLALAASDLACKPHGSAFGTPSTSTISSPSTSSSHSIQTTSDQRALSAAALHHRVLAIKSLQNALAQGINDMEAGNAMLATCYVLVFQSSLISDGFPEFMSFIRGCMLVAFQMGVKRMKFIFENMMPDDQLRVVGPSLERDPGLTSSVMDPAIESLRKCEHLMMKPYVKEFFSALMEIAVKSQESSRGAYLGIMRIYGIFGYTMSQADFIHLIDPSNIVGLLLQAHLVAMQTILEPVLNAEQSASQDNKMAKAGPKHMGSLKWLDSIHNKVDDHWKVYFRWTMQRAEELRGMVWEGKHMCDRCDTGNGCIEKTWNGWTI